MTDVDFPILPGGRLTIVSGNPYGEGSGSVIYYTPCVHDYVRLYNTGTSAWGSHQFTEASLVLPDVANKNVDIFFANASGLALNAVQWSSDTARATDIAYQNGVLVKSGSISNLYLGSVRCSTTGSTNDSETQRFVINNYNMIRKPMINVDSTAHAYTSGTDRPWNNDTTTRVEGLVPTEQHRRRCSTGAVAEFRRGIHGNQSYWSISVNATATLNNWYAYAYLDAQARVGDKHWAVERLGYSYWQPVERGNNPNGYYWYNKVWSHVYG